MLSDVCEAAGGPAAVWCHSGLLPRRSSALSSCSSIWAHRQTPHPPQRAVPENTPVSPATLPLQPLGPNHSVLFSHAQCLTLCLFCQEELELHFVPLKRREREWQRWKQMEFKGHLLRNVCCSTNMNFSALSDFFLQNWLFIDFARKQQQYLFLLFFQEYFYVPYVNVFIL